MNITLQTNNFNSKKYNYSHTQRNNKYTNSPSFGSITPPAKSTFLDPLKKVGENFTDLLAKYYTQTLYGSKLAEYLSTKAESLKSVADHMQVIGSTIISGMYMTQTLRNKDFDEKRKKTLALNQFLTFAVSTAGGYFIDKRIENKWEKLTRKYAVNRTGDKDLLNKLAIYEQKCINEAQQLGKKYNSKDLLINYFKDAKEVHYDENLARKIRGMGILRSLLVFGTIYRFISPVAVTPLATWISNKFINKEDNTAS